MKRINSRAFVAPVLRNEVGYKVDRQRSLQQEVDYLSNVQLASPMRSMADTLGCNDMVMIDKDLYTITGVIVLSQNGFEKKQYWLDGPGGKRWLTVDGDPVLQVKKFTTLRSTLKPKKRNLTANGAKYKFKEFFVGSYRALGDSGLTPMGVYQHYRYAGPLGETLYFERFNLSHWKVSIGYELFTGSYAFHKAPGSV